VKGALVTPCPRWVTYAVAQSTSHVGVARSSSNSEISAPALKARSLVFADHPQALEAAVGKHRRAEPNPYYG
jgi:hypothetical protein